MSKDEEITRYPEVNPSFIEIFQFCREIAYDRFIMSLA